MDEGSPQSPLGVLYGLGVTTGFQASCQASPAPTRSAGVWTAEFFISPTCRRGASTPSITTLRAALSQTDASSHR
jgi:hypothetical protein